MFQEHTHRSSLKDNLSSHCHIPYSPEADAYYILLACSVNPKNRKTPLTFPDMHSKFS